ncbi:MAG: hypothetical protein AAF710_06395 [Planctomycetota bacterium]
MGLEGVELIMELEEVFGVEITDAEVAELQSVGDIHEVVRRKLTADDPVERGGRCTNCRYPKRGLTSDRCPECGSVLTRPDQVDSGTLWDEIVQIVSLELSVKPQTIKPETRLVEDLKIG